MDDCLVIVLLTAMAGLSRWVRFEMLGIAVKYGLDDMLLHRNCQEWCVV